MEKKKGISDVVITTMNEIEQVNVIRSADCLKLDDQKKVFQVIDLWAQIECKKEVVIYSNTSRHRKETNVPLAK
jgi:hypothetical protein